MNTVAIEFHEKQEAFRKELAGLLNRHSMENGSNTPDYLLADYLIACLRGLDSAIRMRDGHYGYRQFTHVVVGIGTSGNVERGPRPSGDGQ